MDWSSDGRMDLSPAWFNFCIVQNNSFCPTQRNKPVDLKFRIVLLGKSLFMSKQCEWVAKYCVKIKCPNIHFSGMHVLSWIYKMRLNASCFILYYSFTITLLAFVRRHTCSVPVKCQCAAEILQLLHLFLRLFSKIAILRQRTLNEREKDTKWNNHVTTWNYFLNKLHYTYIVLKREYRTDLFMPAFSMWVHKNRTLIMLWTVWVSFTGHAEPQLATAVGRCSSCSVLRRH